MHDGSMERQQLLHYEEILRNADQFVTVQRRALLKHLLRHRVHPTTAQIASAVGRSGSASLATVYNNLALFAELAIVRTCAAPAARSTGTSAPIAIITWSVPTVATSTTYPKNRLRQASARPTSSIASPTPKRGFCGAATAASRRCRPALLHKSTRLGQRLIL